jgi:hypothetical protein
VSSLREEKDVFEKKVIELEYATMRIKQLMEQLK